MKKLLTLAVAAAMTLSVAAASATTLKLSEVHAEGYPTTLADQEFARLIEEKTEGRIKVEVYSGGQLYGEETGSIEALQLGDIDAQLIDIEGLPKLPKLRLHALQL